MYLELFKSDSPYNYSRYKNEKVDELLNASQLEVDAAKRMDMLHQADQIIVDDAAFLPQAESQLQGSGIRLQKMGEPEVPTIAEYIESVLGESENIGFDGRTIGITEGEQYEKIAKEKHGQVYYGCDLIDEIWEERPALSEKQIGRAHV